MVALQPRKGNEKAELNGALWLNAHGPVLRYRLQGKVRMAAQGGRQALL